MPADIGEPLSGAYLSMIERGRVRGVSFKKLASLAVIYNVPVAELIDFAPPTLRERLQREYRAWHSEPGRPPLDPNPAISPPLSPDADEMLATRLVDARIPFGDAHAAATVRDFVAWSVLPAALSSLAPAFWKDRARQASAFQRPLFREMVRMQAAGSFDFWKRMCLAAQRWYLESVTPPDFIALVARWTFDYERRMGGIQFVDPVLDSKFGISTAPAGLIIHLRLFASAVILSREAATALQLPPPPTLHDVLAEYLFSELPRHSGFNEPPSAQHSPLQSFGRLIRAALDSGEPAERVGLPAPVVEGIRLAIAQAERLSSHPHSTPNA